MKIIIEMYNRQLKKELLTQLTENKIIVLIGPRQVGKTTLINEILSSENVLNLNGDDPSVQDLLKNVNTERLRSIVGGHQFVFIDEAQRIDGIGITLKLLHDEIPEIKVIASGSSAFELKGLINEPLTGRKREYHLYPISWREFEEKIGFVKAYQQLENRLLFGMYPEVLNSVGNERRVLSEITESYLYKDILSFSGIRKPDVLQKILKALAYQIGNEVSYNEIAQLVGVDKNTVNQYITILEQAYVVFTLKSFSRNLRNEIKTNQKVYFYDVGVRNAVIQNFSPLGSRMDLGALWENFLLSERLKQNAYQKTYTTMHFWRTVSQQEIDLIEEVDGKISAFEFKWNTKKNYKTPKSFLEAYQTEVEIIHPNNFQAFVNR